MEDHDTAVAMRSSTILKRQENKIGIISHGE